MTEAADAGYRGPETTKPPERPGVAEIRDKVKLFLTEPDGPNYQLPFKITSHTDTAKPGKISTTKNAVSNGIPLASHTIETDTDGKTIMETHELNGSVGNVNAQLMLITMADGPSELFAVLPDANNIPVSVIGKFSEGQISTIRNTFGIELGTS